MHPVMLVGTCLFVALLAIGCVDDSKSSGPSVDASGSSSELAACGSPADSEIPCCPRVWQIGDRCDHAAQSSSCWTACDAKVTEADGGISLNRSQLSCGEDGKRSIGKGLFPCTP